MTWPTDFPETRSKRHRESVRRKATERFGQKVVQENFERRNINCANPLELQSEWSNFQTSHPFGPYRRQSPNQATDPWANQRGLRFQMFPARAARLAESNP